MGFIFLTAVVLAAMPFRLFSNYQDAQPSTYTKMLSTDDKDAIQQRGEITRQIVFNDPARHSLLKGKLRILKTEDPQTFKFVEVGEWVSHGHHVNFLQSNDFEFRDKLLYDENGNTLSRRIYEKHGESFQVKEEWSSEVKEGRFLQHVKVYEDGVVAEEYTWRVKNYLEPMSDSQKDKIHFGTDRVYYPDGKVAYVRSYNDDGKLISEEKFENKAQS